MLAKLNTAWLDDVASAVTMVSWPLLQTMKVALLEPVMAPDDARNS
jgi:hypothetical protein